MKSEDGITLLHGQNFNLGKFIVVPMYHPAATIYDRQKKIDIEKDFKKLKKIIKEELEN